MKKDSQRLFIQTLRNIGIICAVFSAAVLVVKIKTQNTNPGIASETNQWAISGNDQPSSSSKSNYNQKTSYIDLTQNNNDSISDSETDNNENDAPNTSSITLPDTTQTTADTTVNTQGNASLSDTTDAQINANFLDEQLVNPDNLKL